MKKILTLFVCMLCLCFAGCGNCSDDKDALPIGATNIKNIGNGWSTFERDGNTFMFRYKWVGDSCAMAITQVVEN